MKTFATIVLVFIAATTNVNAQIPNSGFENWTPVGNCMEPTGWFSLYSLFDTTGIYCPVTRSFDHFPALEGNYSVRIQNDTALWNTGTIPGSYPGWGLLTT